MRRPWQRAGGILLVCAGSLFGQAQVGESFGVSLNPAQKSARQFHGGFYHLFRSDALDARSFFDTRVQPYQYRDLRVALAGPFWVPGLLNPKSQKWFLSWGLAWNEESRLEHRRATVPTAAERLGDFRNSPLCTDAFRQQVPDCQVPPGSWSRYGQQLLAPYPLPNTEGETFNLVRQASRQTAVWQHTAGLEYAPLGRLKAGLRLSREAFEQRLPFQGSALGNAPVERRRSSDAATLRLSIALNPKSVKTITVAGTRISQFDRSLNPLLTRLSPGSGGSELFSENLTGLLPAVSITGFSGYSAGRTPGFSRDTLTLRFEHSRTAGKHELKLGAMWMRNTQAHEISSMPTGAVTFSPQGGNSTGNPLADAFLGRFASYQEGRTLLVKLLSHQWEFAMGDKWKLRPYLVVEFGLSYSLMPAERSARGRLANFLPWLFQAERAQPVARDGILIEGLGDPLNGIESERTAGPGLYFSRHRDLAPRAGFSWQPFQKRKLTVRAGGTISFDRPRLDPAMGNNLPIQTLTRLAGELGDPSSGRKAPTRPPPLLGVHPDFPDATIYGGSAHVEQELGRHSLTVGYKTSLGRRLLRQRNLNQLAPGTLLRLDGMHPDALRPFLGYGTITWREAGGNSSFHALELAAVARKPTAGFTYNLRYSFSKMLTDSIGEGEFPQDHFNLRNERGVAALDRRHVLVIQYSYQPTFGKAMPAWARRVLCNWEITGLSKFSTGRPFDITQPGDQARMGGGVQRPDAVAAPYLPHNRRSVSRYFDVEVFRSPAPGLLGNAARYLVFGPGTNNFNLSLARTMALSKRWQGQFRAEFSNVFNHPSFSALGTVFDLATYLLPSSTFGRITGAGPGRSVQLTFKATF